MLLDCETKLVSAVCAAIGSDKQTNANRAKEKPDNGVEYRVILFIFRVTILTQVYSKLLEQQVVEVFWFLQ